MNKRVSPVAILCVIAFAILAYLLVSCGSSKRLIKDIDSNIRAGIVEEVSKDEVQG